MDISNYLPTAELQREFEEFQKLKTEEERQLFKQKRLQNFESKTEDEKKAYIENSESGLSNSVKEAEVLLDRVTLGEVSNMISVAYIAQKYFGKTRQWLYQRLNGNIVHGRPAQFTEDERIRLKEALQDISEHIQQTSFKIA